MCNGPRIDTMMTVHSPPSLLFAACPSSHSTTRAATCPRPRHKGAGSLAPGRPVGQAAARHDAIRTGHAPARSRRAITGICQRGSAWDAGTCFAYGQRVRPGAQRCGARARAMAGGALISWWGEFCDGRTSSGAVAEFLVSDWRAVRLHDGRA